MLGDFITEHRDEIIQRCRDRVAVRSVIPAADVTTDHGVPLFLNQLVDALRRNGTDRRGRDISASAVLHGRYLLREGFTVSQVVHGYGDVCQSITDLAVELDARIPTPEFRTLNACLDDAIAGAVTEFGRGRNQSTLDGEAARSTERLGFLAHELRNLMHTAILAFEVLKRGDVGAAGSTGRVLERTLLGARDLIGRSLAEMRLQQSVQHAEQVLVATLIADVTPGALLEAQARGIDLVVLPIENGVVVTIDRQVLTAVLLNVLQNAFKFTKPQTTVTLRVRTSEARVFIEVEDECGGIGDGDRGGEELFRPFEQRGTDRSGMGLGLAFSRWGVEANNGRIYAQNVHDKGCVFVINLPRHVTEPLMP